MLVCRITQKQLNRFPLNFVEDPSRGGSRGWARGALTVSWPLCVDVAPDIETS